MISAVSIIKIEIFTEIERYRKLDLGILNFVVWQSANGREHWITGLATNAILISPQQQSKSNQNRNIH